MWKLLLVLTAVTWISLWKKKLIKLDISQKVYQISLTEQEIVKSMSKPSISNLHLTPFKHIILEFCISYELSSVVVKNILAGQIFHHNLFQYSCY